ncbi:MAG: arginine N-succinyltransferase, partial [Brevundimonas sp.]|nr:arginine N-succinyltransferase [Brevundimonas sp.]
RDNIRTVRDARSLTVAVANEVEAELPALISTNSAASFRSVRQRAAIEGDTVTLTTETADALRVRAGDTVRVKT